MWTVFLVMSVKILTWNYLAEISILGHSLVEMISTEEHEIT